MFLLRISFNRARCALFRDLSRGCGASVMVLNIFILSLMPLGINKISSDYLASRVYNKMAYVNICWTAGIVLEVIGIFWVNRVYAGILNIVPSIYLLMTVLVYFFVTGYAFYIGRRNRGDLSAMVHLLTPPAVALLSVVLCGRVFDGLPSMNIMDNARYSFFSVAGTVALAWWFIKKQ